VSSLIVLSEEFEELEQVIGGSRGREEGEEKAVFVIVWRSFIILSSSL